MDANKVTRSVAMLAAGLLAASVPHASVGAQPMGGQVAYCYDADPQNVALREYAIALMGGNSFSLDGPTRVVARATLVLRDASKLHELYPVLGEDRGDLLVQCKDPIRLERLPLEVTMETLTPANANELIARLKAFNDNSLVQRAKKIPSWPPFLLFNKNGFQATGNPHRSPDFRELVANYGGLRDEPAFLTDLPYQVKLTSNFGFAFTHAAKGAPGQVADANQSGSPQQGNNLTPAQQMAAQRNNANNRGRPGATPQQQPVAAGGRPAAAALPGPVHLTPVEITIKFRANHDQWQAVLKDPNLFDTYDYCNNPTALSGGAYKLTCNLRPDNKLPIHIRGFKEILVSPDGPPLDDVLEVSGFSYPYPSAWKRPMTEFVAVASGPLRSVLGQRIPLSQGVAGCQTEIAVTIANIVSGTLQPFPAEPCRAYNVSFPQLQLAPAAQVVSGCIPGMPEQPIAIQNGKVSCWARNGQNDAVKIRAQLFNGFHPLDLTIPAGAIDVEFDYGKLAAALQPVWPYAQGLTGPGERPGYVARSVAYDGGAPCGGPVTQAANGALVLPSLAVARCGQMPRTMTVTFEQDANAQTGSAAPPQAFKASYPDTVELATVVQEGRTIQLDQLKVPLPVQFSAEDARAFNAQFGTEAGNNQFPGVFLFRGDNCTTKRDGKFLAFNAQPSQDLYKWPVKAAVFDSSEEALTICATAVVGGIQGAAPYLTFGLRGARAIGPRRAIVISMSQNLATRGGVRELQGSLRTFVDQISAEVAQGGRLSPINVFLVNGSGDLKQVFTGEMAAIDKAKVKALIEQQQESVAPVTPDFKQLRFMPELLKNSAENFDHVTFVMDGTEVPPDNTDFLNGLATRLKNPDFINLLIMGNCQPWMEKAPNIRCTQLSPDAAQRSELLVKTFAKFINPSELQAANPQAQPEQPGQPRPGPQAPGPAPTPTGSKAPPPSRGRQ